MSCGWLGAQESQQRGPPHMFDVRRFQLSQDRGGLIQLARHSTSRCRDAQACVGDHRLQVRRDGLISGNHRVHGFRCIDRGERRDGGLASAGSSASRNPARSGTLAASLRRPKELTTPICSVPSSVGKRVPQRCRGLPPGIASNAPCAACPSSLLLNKVDKAGTEFAVPICCSFRQT